MPHASPCPSRPSSLRPLSRCLRVVPMVGLVLAMVGAGVGCQQDRRARIDPYETTASEERSQQVLPVALLEFSDQAAPRLVASISELPEVREDASSTVIVGDIENQTRIVPTSDFEVAVRRLRNKLINSEIAGERLAFVERRARVGRLAERERVVKSEGETPTPRTTTRRARTP